MLSLDEFKKAMGDKAKNYTEEEIIKQRDILDQFADLIFDIWLEKKNKQKKSQTEKSLPTKD